MTAPARRRRGLDAGSKVAVVDQRALHRSIVAGVADGLRHGVPVDVLDGYAAHMSLHQLVIVNDRSARVEHLTRERDHARDLAKRARALATSEPDDEVAADYRADARTHAARARSLDEQITAITTAQSTPQVPPVFTGEVEYLITGLTALLAADGKMTREQRAAWRTVVHAFRVIPDGAALRWELELLVPAEGQVMVLGPFTGTVPARGKVLSPAEQARLGAPQASGQRRRERIHALLEAGYPLHLARCATLAPTDHLARALLGEDVTWPDCPPAFDHDAFTTHVRTVWGAHPGWGKGVYLQTAPKRQALADLLAALGGSATIADLDPHLPALGLVRNDLYALSLPRLMRHPSTPAWPPTVERDGVWSAGTKASHSRLVSPRCGVCGEPATAVVRVPEVPDALLCRSCRVMPSRPDLVFPPLYLDLALPPTDLTALALPAPPAARRGRRSTRRPRR